MESDYQSGGNEYTKLPRRRLHAGACKKQQNPPPCFKGELEGVVAATSPCPLLGKEGKARELSTVNINDRRYYPFLVRDVFLAELAIAFLLISAAEEKLLPVSTSCSALSQ